MICYKCLKNYHVESEDLDSVTFADCENFSPIESETAGNLYLYACLKCEVKCQNDMNTC